MTSKEQPDPRHSDGHSGPHETGAKEDDLLGSNAGSHGSSPPRHGLHRSAEVPLPNRTVSKSIGSSWAGVPYPTVTL